MTSKLCVTRGAGRDYVIIVRGSKIEINPANERTKKEGRKKGRKKDEKKTEEENANRLPVSCSVSRPTPKIVSYIFVFLVVVGQLEGRK